MNDGASGWQGQFSQGFNSPGHNDNGGILIWVVVIAGLLIGAWYLYEQYRKATASVKRRAPRTEPVKRIQPTSVSFVAVPGKINPLQQKLIHEMIDEFRKQEPSAQAVPSAVLEKYSEFFFHNQRQLKTNDREVEEFINMNYPIKPGYSVELDVNIPGSLHLIKAKVIEVDPKSLVVEFTSPVPAFLKRGTPLTINYSVGKHFLQGTTSISEVRQDVGIILRRPSQVSLTSERRYTRVALKTGPGSLLDLKTGEKTPLKVLDLSFEGVRMQVGRPLDKSHTYQLTFETQAGGKAWGFGPIEGVPSKGFLTGSGTYESGLVFLYLDVANRAKVQAFMRQLAQELQDSRGTTTPG